MRRLTFSVVIVLVVGAIAWFGLRTYSSAGLVTLAYVANGANNNIQVVDVDSGQTLRKIYAGISPWRLVRSPDEKQLWAQHWYSESTAVIDLNDHEVSMVLPYRGPGIFSNEGDQFVTFNWPRSGLYQLDPKDGKGIGVKVTEISKVYDLIQKQDGKGFYMTRYDPVTKVDQEQYKYVLFYPFDIKNNRSSNAVKSHPTGLSPVGIVKTKEPFILTVDSETNGLSLINKLGSGRGIPTCPAPKAVILSPDETRMVVMCWRGQGIKESTVVSYKTDFTARPWPTITQAETVTIAGGVVAGRFNHAGDRLYVLDQPNKQLLELDANTMKTLRSIATGDVPMDVELVQVSKSVRDRLKNEESRSRQAVKKIIAKMQNNSAAYSDLSWQETGTWQDSLQKSEVEEAETEDASAQEEPLTTKRTQYIKGPDWFRSEAENGLVRLAQGGSNIAIHDNGRFWVAPRQTLGNIIYGLANLSVDEAIQYLAGDVPGSPYLRSGIAVDVMMEVEGQKGHKADDEHAKENGSHEAANDQHRYIVIGASKEGQQVSQVWVNADSGYVENLIEKFPVDQAEGHDAGVKKFGGVIETKYFDYKKVQDKYAMPGRLERVFDNGLVEDVEIDNVVVNSGIPDAKFTLARLGNAGRIPELSPAESESGDGKPGMLFPSMGYEHIYGPFETHVPFNSNPPTSGPHLPFTAEWGVYGIPVPLVLQVNKLVAGGIIIQYNCPEACADTIAQLEDIVNRYPQFVQLSPYPLLDKKIALTAWQRLELLDEVDEARIVEFIEAHKGINHHAG